LNRAEWEFDEAEHGEKHRCLALQLQRLFASLQCTSRGAVSTAAVTRSFGWEGAEAFVQHDVQECMAHVLDHLTMFAATSSLGHHVMEEQQGRLRKYVLCHECGYLSPSAEVFTALPVPIKGYRILEEALAAMVTPEQLAGSEQYSCPSCGKRVDASLGRYFDGEWRVDGCHVKCS
jgi:ubiquitin carboxyl-terminal hydrolase 47